MALAKSIDSYNKGVPIDIEANKLTLFRNEKVVIAEGDVKVEQGADQLYANKIVIFKDESKYHAIGDVMHLRGDESKAYGDEAILYKIDESGLIKNFYLKSEPHALMASKYAQMQDKNNLLAHDMVYSSCHVCKDNFVENMPTWQFRTEQSLWNREDERIYHHHARIEMFGVPVLYTPYLSTPAPGAKRKSGFLMPKFEFSSANLGFNAKIPYYFNLAPDKDMTYAPRFTEFLGVVHELEYRQLLENGNYQINAYGTKSPKFNTQGQEIKGKSSYLGSYKLVSDFTIPSGIASGYLSMDSKMMKDRLKTFNIKYGYGTEQVLVSDFNYRKIGDNHFVSLRPIYFQELRADYNQKTTPQLYPLAEARVQSEALAHDVFAAINFASMNREEGLSYNRLSGGVGAKKQFALPAYSMFTYGFDTGMDVYKVDTKPVTVPTNYVLTGSNRHSDHHRLRSNLFAKLKQTNFVNLGGNHVIIEPVAMPVVTGVSDSTRNIPNEDSQDPEITAANLFEVNRFKGFDRVEKGVRTNYGVQGSISNSYLRGANFVIGQIWRRKIDNDFNKFSGMNRRFSDYVASLDIDLFEWLTLVNNYRFRRSDLSALRSENGFESNLGRFKISGLYSATHASLLTVPNRYKEEISGKLGVDLYRGWSLDLSASSRLGKKIQSQGKKMLNYGVNLAYKSECMDFSAGIVRSYTSNKDVKPSTTPMIQIDIPAF